MINTPAHKQTDPDKKPGQIVNPINTDMMDDMGQYASPIPERAKLVTWPSVPLTRRGNPT